MASRIGEKHIPSLKSHTVLWFQTLITLYFIFTEIMSTVNKTWPYFNHLFPAQTVKLVGVIAEQLDYRFRSVTYRRFWRWISYSSIWLKSFLPTRQFCIYLFEINVCMATQLNINILRMKNFCAGFLLILLALLLPEYFKCRTSFWKPKDRSSIN